MSESLVILPSGFRVPILILLVTLVGFYRLLRARETRRLEDDFAASRGCKPARQWNSKWPLGLDILTAAFKHGRRGRILRFFLDIIDDNGVTFEQQLLFSRSIDTIDPRNIEAVLPSQFADFGLGLRPPTFDPLLGSGIFTQDEAAWRHSRDLLRPQFMSNRIQNFDQIADCVQNLVDCIPNGEIVDLQPLFFSLTFDTTTFLLFGRQLSSLKSEGIASQESSFANAFNIGQDYLAWRGRLGEFYWAYGGNRFKHACQICHEFVDAMVQDALSKPVKTESEDHSSNYVFLDALVKETRDAKVLRDQCMNILLAGRDTTACCLSWTFRLLVRHPSVLSRLRAEVQNVVGLGIDASTPTLSDLKRLTYLSLVLKEVLRLYPSVPVNSRAAKVMTSLPKGGGQSGEDPILLRKGEAVGYSVYAMHRRKEIYGADANLFRPERWEGDALRNVGWGYLPFNGGPRVCLGQDFALLEAGYTVARIVQVFDCIELPESESVSQLPLGEEKQTLTLVVASGEGCCLRMANTR